MDFRFSLLLITACTTSSPSTTSSAPVVESPNHHPLLSMPETPTSSDMIRLITWYHEVLSKRMLTNAMTANSYDPQTGGKALKIVDAIQTLIPVILTGYDDQWNPIYENHLCTSPHEQHFSLKMLIDPSNLSGETAAVWNGRQGLLVMNPRISPYEAYLPFTGFHEGFHMLDPRTIAAKNLDYTNLEEPSPLEDDAISFESRMINASSHGRYDQLIQAWAQAVLNGQYPFIVSQNTMVAPAPWEFRDLMTKSGEIQVETPSTCFQVMLWDLNIELTKHSTLAGADLAQVNARRYKRMYAALGDPAVVKFAGPSLSSWLQ